MVIEIPFEVGTMVCFSNSRHIFNAGTVEAIEAEIFVKVRDRETGDVEIYKPEQIFSKEAAREYVNSVLARLDALEG